MVSEQSEDTGQDQSEWKVVPAQDAGFKQQKVEVVATKLFVGAGARILFYPTLLYNVVRNKLQAEFRWWDRIDQFLLLGAVPFPKDVIRLKDLGVEAVVTLNESYETLVPTSMYQSQGIKHLVIPTQDYLFAPSFEDIRRAVEFIHDNIQQAKTTYVHCKAGRGRSTTVVLCYLVEHRGMTPIDAFCYVRSRRPRVLLAASQWKAVKEYSERQHLNLISECPLSVKMSLAQHWPISICLPPPDKCFEIPGKEEGSTCSEDLPVLVSSTDLDGYRGIQDAGLIGNELWKELGVAYRVRFIAARRVIGVARASAALARLSCLWLGCQAGTGSLGPTLMHASSEVKSESTVGLQPPLTGQTALSHLDVPICKQGMVQC